MFVVFVPPGPIVRIQFSIDALIDLPPYTANEQNHSTPNARLIQLRICIVPHLLQCPTFLRLSIHTFWRNDFAEELLRRAQWNFNKAPRRCIGSTFVVPPAGSCWTCYILNLFSFPNGWLPQLWLLYSFRLPIEPTVCSMSIRDYLLLDQKEMSSYFEIDVIRLF
jgi:hypothetical protein